MNSAGISGPPSDGTCIRECLAPCRVGTRAHVARFVSMLSVGLSLRAAALNPSLPRSKCVSPRSAYHKANASNASGTSAHSFLARYGILSGTRTMDQSNAGSQEHNALWAGTLIDQQLQQDNLALPQMLSLTRVHHVTQQTCLVIASPSRISSGKSCFPVHSGPGCESLQVSPLRVLIDVGAPRRFRDRVNRTSRGGGGSIVTLHALPY